MSKKLPDWLGVGSIDELMGALYPPDKEATTEYAQIRIKSANRAKRLLLSDEMARVWKTLEGGQSHAGDGPDLVKFFWVAMNVNLFIEPVPEPSNSEIKKRYASIADAATKLESELRFFADEVGVSPYDDVAKMLVSIARIHSTQKPDDLDIDRALFAQEFQYPHHGFNDGRFEKALHVLALGSREVSGKRQSRNRITKANSPSRMRYEIALVMTKAASEYLGSPYDEAVASTVNAILDLVEDGEAISGDSVKKLRRIQ